MKKRIKGKCKYCGQEYTFSYMSRHLSACEERQKKLMKKTIGRKRGYFELAICSKYDKNYWLFIEVKETATLKDIDDFLRDIWVECCGHLSEFDIDGVSYQSDLGGGIFWYELTESMDCKLKSVLTAGMTFSYEYDFGSTTELILKVTNYRMGIDRKEKLIILSRNNPMEFLCSKCGKKPAVYLHTDFYFENVTFLCEDCVKTDESDENMLFEVCNSPRMGVCGYCGSDVYPDQFVPDTEIKKS